MPSITPVTTASPMNANILANALHLPTIARFHYLFDHANSLIGLYGPYSMQPNTTVFTRATHTHPNPNGPSSKSLAASLAAAQDSVFSAQPPGPAKEDLDIFHHLWTTTIDLLELILSTGDLDHESFGWGIFSLCAGYMYPPSEASVEIFEDYKHRLHEALLALPTMDSPGRNRQGLVVKARGSVEVLVKANKEVHVCASLLLQRFRQEGWQRVRWWHGVKVAERWVDRLELVDPTEELEMMDGGENVP